MNNLLNRDLNAILLQIEKQKSVITQVVVDTHGDRRAKSFMWSGGPGQSHMELQIDIENWDDDVDVYAYAI